MARVAVVVPTHDRASVLPRALRSVLDQSVRDLELIVVDDASTDGTRALLAAWDDPRLRVLHLPENVGAAAARNAGIEAATAPIVAFLDSDDAWLPGKLEAQLPAFDDPAVGVAYTGYRVLRGERVELGPTPRHGGDLSRELLRHDVLSPTSCVAVRRPLLDQVGGFDPDLPARQDYDLWLRLADVTRFAPVPEVLVELHVDQPRITGDVDARLRGHEVVLQRIEERARDLPEAERRRILADQRFVLALHCHQQGRRDLAAGYVRGALDANPRHAKAWALRALVALNVPLDSPPVLALRNLAKRLGR